MPPRDRAYLDYNATSPLRPAAREAVLRALAEAPGNPSSVHAEGRAARAALDAARRGVAEALGARAGDVVLTASASEANNLALKGLAFGPAGRERRTLLTSAVEHPSVLEAAAWLAGGGAGGGPAGPGGPFRHATLPVDGAGRVEVAALEERLDADVLVVSVLAAGHETGVLAPVSDLARACRAAGALLHVDATQALGRVPVDVEAWGADLVAVSGHKVGGPRGAGALWVRPGVPLAPLVHGGPQERRRRAGTEDVAAAAGLAAACAEAVAALPEEAPRLAALRDALWDGVRARVPDAVRLGDPAHVLPNTLCVAFPGADGEALLFGLDLAGVAASSGAACSAGSVEPSRVLLAMGVPRALAGAAVRFSLGFASTADDVARALEALPEVVARAREDAA